MDLRAEVISIGDELTSGNRLDTNSQWISQRLGDLGIATAYHTTVGDRIEDNVRVFRQAAERVDIVISTGGLGPTADDLTREAIADAFQCPAELRREALEHVQRLFAKRNRPMPERNIVQAMFPKTSIIIHNPHGTAPGIDITVQETGTRIFALPGVPAEMRQMMIESVEPTLVRDLGAGSERWFYKSIKLFGIGESDVEKEIPDLIARKRDPIVGITVSQATITLRIAALCREEQEFQQKIQSTENEIRSKLSDYIFGEGEIELDQVVCELLESKQIKLGVLEWGAGNWISSSLSRYSSPTRSAYGLCRSVWHPAIRSEDELPSCIESESEELFRSTDVDIVLAVGTYPSKEEIEKTELLPMSDFTIVVKRRNLGPLSKQVTLGAHPDVLYARLAKTGLNYLRAVLINNE